MPDEMVPPRAFISYSWTSPTHEDWVIHLASDLCDSGVDVILDKWELKEGHDKFAFMETMVTDPHIHKVVIICDKRYMSKADDRAGGVGAETQIITPELYAKVSQEKFVVIVTELDEYGNPYVPAFYGSRIFIDFTDEANRSESFDQLLRWIFGKPVYVKPPIGKPPAFITDDDSIIRMATSSRFIRACDALRNGRGQSAALAMEYFETISTEFSQLRIRSEEDREFDDLVLENLEAFLPHRNQIVDMFSLLSKFGHKGEAAKIVHRFFESLIPYMSRSGDRSTHRGWEVDNYRFLVHELFLYALACFIRDERFDIAEYLMISGYYVSDESGRYSSKLATFGIFGQSTDSLKYRNQRKKMRRLSLRTDLLKHRAQDSSVRFHHLMQADFTLFLRGQIDRNHQMWWYPVTLLYSCLEECVFEMFVRSESAHYFESVKSLLGISDKNALGKVLAEFDRNPASLPRWGYQTLSPRQLVGFQRLASKP